MKNIIIILLSLSTIMIYSSNHPKQSSYKSFYKLDSLFYKTIENDKGKEWYLRNKFNIVLNYHVNYDCSYRFKSWFDLSNDKNNEVYKGFIKDFVNDTLYFHIIDDYLKNEYCDYVKSSSIPGGTCIEIRQLSKKEIRNIKR